MIGIDWHRRGQRTKRIKTALRKEGETRDVFVWSGGGEKREARTVSLCRRFKDISRFEKGTKSRKRSYAQGENNGNQNG